MSKTMAITEANCRLEPLDAYSSIGKVDIKGKPMKNVPVNSSSEVRKTNTALASSPGAASGKVICTKALNFDAPTLRAASSSSGGILLNAALEIQTAKTKLTIRWMRTTPWIVLVKPNLVNVNNRFTKTGC